MKKRADLLLWTQFLRQMASSLFLLNAARRYKTKAELMKIKAAQAYILTVKKVRLVSIGIVLVAISLALLICGLVLLHQSVFVYSMLSQQNKFFVSLFLGAFEFLTAIGILYLLFREETWSRFSELHKVMQAVINTQDKREKADVA